MTGHREARPGQSSGSQTGLRRSSPVCWGGVSGPAPPSQESQNQGTSEPEVPSAAIRPAHLDGRAGRGQDPKDPPGARAQGHLLQAPGSPQPGPASTRSASLSCPGGSPGLGRAEGQPQRSVRDIPPSLAHTGRTKAQGSCCRPLGPTPPHRTGEIRQRAGCVRAHTPVCTHPLHMHTQACTCGNAMYTYTTRVRISSTHAYTCLRLQK